MYADVAHLSRELQCDAAYKLVLSRAVLYGDKLAGASGGIQVAVGDPHGASIVTQVCVWSSSHYPWPVEGLWYHNGIVYSSCAEKCDGIWGQAFDRRWINLHFKWRNCMKSKVNPHINLNCVSKAIDVYPELVVLLVVSTTKVQ